MQRAHLLWYAVLTVFLIAVGECIAGLLLGQPFDEGLRRFLYQLLGVAAFTVILWAAIDPSHDALEDAGDTRLQPEWHPPADGGIRFATPEELVERGALTPMSGPARAAPR